MRPNIQGDTSRQLVLLSFGTDCSVHRVSGYTGLLVSRLLKCLKKYDILQGNNYNTDHSCNLKLITLVNIPSTGEHCTNALPDIPCTQVQTGTWFTTEHKALTPQIPRPHGSRHLFLMQARSLGQSEFKTHSGRHPKFGFPWYSGRQLHIPLKHCVFAPQFKHGSVGLSVVSEERIFHSVYDETKFKWDIFHI